MELYIMSKKAIFIVFVLWSIHFFLDEDPVKDGRC